MFVLRRFADWQGAFGRMTAILMGNHFRIPRRTTGFASTAAWPELRRACTPMIILRNRRILKLATPAEGE
jgi:hypothetical protein